MFELEGGDVHGFWDCFLLSFFLFSSFFFFEKTLGRNKS